MRGYTLFVLTIQWIYRIHILDGYTLPCNASLQTASRVNMCPTDLSSYKTAASKKKCSSFSNIAQNCQSFQYHCVLSDNLKYAVEVCAPSINIIGHVCAKFNSEFRSIIRVEGHMCSECPYSYNSTYAYHYQQCYSNLTGHDSSENNIRNNNNGGILIVSVAVPMTIIFLTAAAAVCTYIIKTKKCRNTIREREEMIDHFSPSEESSMKISQGSSIEKERMLKPTSSSNNFAMTVKGARLCPPSSPNLPILNRAEDSNCKDKKESPVVVITQPTDENEALGSNKLMISGMRKGESRRAPENEENISKDYEDQDKNVGANVN